MVVVDKEGCGIEPPQTEGFGESMSKGQWVEDKTQRVVENMSSNRY